MLFKCKMCGGDLAVEEGMSVCECEYCGTMQTLPKTDNEQQMNMINRANHFRQQCEFDKAMEIYERILKNSEDAEIYWNIVLCRYGIEYVDDPKSKKKIATCHRTQYKSILNDVDYLEALKRADIQQIALYKQEAEYIDSVNKGILEISNKEEPFDIFICYKETDDRGRRTQDSVLAQDLYFQLTQAGYKVFFSRITLESKLGTQYEPYIFAALNSSKVMVVIGTQPEYFNAVWVRNEWSRYLMMMQEDKNKTIIPAYRDMDPYDLPDELSMYQAQDMSKLGFMQDLIRGIEKITNVEPQQTIVKEIVHEERVATNSNLENLIKRGNLALEDGDWDSAQKFFEQVLNEDVEESRAYFGKFLADIKCINEDSLVHTKHDFSDNANYKKAVRFGDEAYKNKMAELLNEANYNFAMTLKKSAKTDDDYRNAKAQFLKISKYKDSVKLAEECEGRAVEFLYQKALSAMQLSKNDVNYDKVASEFEKLKDYKDSKQKVIECRNESKYYIAKKFKEYNTKDDLQKAITRYEEIIDFKDSRQQIENCKTRIAEIEAEEKRIALERERIHQERIRQEKRNKIKTIIAIVVTIVVGVAVTVGIILGAERKRKIEYNNAQVAYNNGEYEEALELFTSLGDYKDSEDKAIELENHPGCKEIGDVYEFGKYSWYIINKTDDGCTLLCKDIVAEMPFDEDGESNEWATSDVRAWLNNDFYNEFTTEEQTMIAETELTDVGTTDKIFLLSKDEVEDIDVNILDIDIIWDLRTPSDKHYENSDLDRYNIYWFYCVNGGDSSSCYSIRYDEGIRPALNLKF